MGDKELLKLAAKAAGYRVSNRLTDGGLMVISNKRPSPHKWNPLQIKSDSFSLQCLLRMKVNVSDAGYTLVEIDELAISVDEYNVADVESATMRAIVRAAAEAGKLAGG